MNCTQGNTTVPVLETDLCNGSTKPAACIIDSNLYSELSLSEDSTQQQINQAQYLAAINQKVTTDNLQTQVDTLETTTDNLQAQVDNIVLSNQVADNTNIASAINVGSMRYRVSGNSSYFDMVMQVSASTYEWVNVVENSWL